MLKGSRLCEAGGFVEAGGISGALQLPSCLPSLSTHGLLREHTASRELVLHPCLVLMPVARYVLKYFPHLFLCHLLLLGV